MDWCWYREGGTFRNGFASRAEALRDAADEGEDGTIYVGTTMDAVDAMTMYAHASDLAEHIEENMNVDGCRVRVGPGAEEALRQWVRDHLEFDAPVVCLNGDVPSRDEWREVCAGPVPGKGE